MYRIKALVLRYVSCHGKMYRCSPICIVVDMYCIEFYNAGKMKVVVKLRFAYMIQQVSPALVPLSF